jgi:hypothetical protein
MVRPKSHMKPQAKGRGRDDSDEDINEDDEDNLGDSDATGYSM